MLIYNVNFFSSIIFFLLNCIQNLIELLNKLFIYLWKNNKYDFNSHLDIYLCIYLPFLIICNLYFSPVKNLSVGQ